MKFVVHNMELSEAEADYILAEATDVVLNSDGADDFSCPLMFARQGAVERRDDTDGVIDRCGSLSAIWLTRVRPCRS